MTPPLGAAFESLSPRQRDVVREILNGKSDRLAASDLNMSINTFRRQFSRACDRLGLAGARRRWLMVIAAGGTLPAEAVKQ